MTHRNFYDSGADSDRLSNTVLTAHNILLIEDDKQLQEIITDYFSDKGNGTFKISCAGTGSEGKEKYFDKEYDLALLDVGLPDTDGFTICKMLRRDSDIPIIFLTARHYEDDRLYGYHLGCDDYISKPFSLAELYAKVTALIRRDKGMVRGEEITVGAIKLNPYRHTVFVNGAEINPPPKEYEILKILMDNRGKVVSRESLLIKIWGYDFEGNDRVVDNHVKKLRKLLGKAASQIETVIKIGYKLER